MGTDLSIIFGAFILAFVLRMVARGIRVHAAMKYKDFPEMRDRRNRMARIILWVAVAISVTMLAALLIIRYLHL